IIDTYGACIEQEESCFKITAGELVRQLSPVKVSSFSITRHASITTAAILLAAKNEIPLIIFDPAGKNHAMLWSNAYGSLASIRKNQWQFAGSQKGMLWAKEMIAFKS